MKKTSVYELPDKVILNNEITLEKRVKTYASQQKFIIEYIDERGMAHLRAFGSSKIDAFWKMKGLLDSDRIQHAG